MRIAYVCLDPGVPVFGRKGCSVHVQEIVRAMRNRGADVTLFATRLGGDIPADLASLRVVRLPLADAADVARRERSVISVNQSLLQILHAEGPFDLIYERYSLFSYMAMVFARESAIAGILEVNAPLLDEQQNHRQLIDEHAARQATAKAFTLASTCIAVSDEVRRHLLEFHVPPQLVHVVFNGVNHQRFARAERAQRRAADAFRIGFAGTLRPWHGLSTLAAAFVELHAQDPTVQLSIIGDGPERVNLARQLAELMRQHPTAAQFIGSVPPCDVPSLLASLDVGVAPYPALRQFYFSPLKVFEYMAAGIPVVASRIGQLQRLITHGVNGLLCAPDDAAGLAAAISELRSDHLLRTRIAEAGRQTVLRHHTWDGVLGRIFECASVDSLVATSM